MLATIGAVLIPDVFRKWDHLYNTEGTKAVYFYI